MDPTPSIVTLASDLAQYASAADEDPARDTADDFNGPVPSWNELSVASEHTCCKAIAAEKVRH